MRTIGGDIDAARLGGGDAGAPPTTPMPSASPSASPADGVGAAGRLAGTSSGGVGHAASPGRSVAAWSMRSSDSSPVMALDSWYKDKSSSSAAFSKSPCMRKVPRKMTSNRRALPRGAALGVDDPPPPPSSAMAAATASSTSRASSSSRRSSSSSPSSLARVVVASSAASASASRSASGSSRSAETAAQLMTSSAKPRRCTAF
mmetsp:Transcript_13369/g.38486  ORF Transcript_13369/g.38486 Transcript_13369/m.38486 type:complete len:203 (+) Transcript_13369:188-796(+)